MKPAISSRQTGLRLVLLIAVTIWATFWAAFAFLEIASEGWKSPQYGIGALVLMALVTVLAWTHNFTGGFFLIVLGFWGIIFFDNSAAFWMFSLPAIVLGLALLLLALTSSWENRLRRT